MDNKIEIFKNEQFGEVRTILEGEKVLFCAADVKGRVSLTGFLRCVLTGFACCYEVTSCQEQK